MLSAIIHSYIIGLKEYVGVELRDLLPKYLVANVAFSH